MKTIFQIFLKNKIFEIKCKLLHLEVYQMLLALEFAFVWALRWLRSYEKAIVEMEEET